jgi:hypothetical protein
VPHEDVCVVGLDLDLAALSPGQAEVLIAPAGADDDALPELVRALESALERAARAIVVLPGWLEDEALRRLQTAVALLDTDRVAVHRSALPPLGASITAALAAALASKVAGAGPLAGALPAIERELIVGAWAGSVSGLKHPEPSMAQHARSALPGAAFAVRVQPDPCVRTLGRDGAAPFERPDRPIELVVAAGKGADVDWVIDVAVPALGDPPVSEVEQAPGAPGWWGTAKVAELVGYPADLARLADRTVPADLVACRWCAEPVAAGRPCPFCGERNRSGQAGSHSAVGPPGPRS